MKLAKDDPILIIGGGIAGISTAVALQYYEFTNIHIYERAETLPVYPVPVQLGANVLVALSDLTLAEVVQGVAMPWQQLTWHASNGKILKEVDISPITEASGFAPVNITYPELHRILKRELPDTSFHLGEELVSYTLGEDIVEAHFASGTTQECALLIGADGLNSRIRLQLMGRTEIRRDGRRGYHALVERGFLDQADHPAFSQPQREYWGLDKLCVLAAQSELNASISLYAPAPKLPPQSLSKWLHNEFQDWESPIPEIIEQVAESAWQSDEVADFAPIKNWYDWRVVLVGDAAHAAYPYLGQSIGMSIESGITLARTIHEHSKKLERAFKKYQKLRRSRTKTATKAAFKRAESMSVNSKIAYSLRNAIMPKLPGFLEEKSFLKLNKERYY